MRFLALLLLSTGSFLATSCAAPDVGRFTRDEADLNRELIGRAAGPAQTCLPLPLGSGSLRPVNAETLVLRQGGTIWVNRLRGACPSLRPFSTIVIEVYGGNYCRGDRFRAVQPGETIPGPYCILGEFMPYRAVSR